MSYARKLDDVALLLDELEGLEGPVSSGTPLEIPLSAIEEDQDQPRRAFDAKTLEELAASIRERGVLQPIGVTPAGPNGMHRIVFGARRYRAAQLAGRSTIAAFIQSGGPSDPYDQMIENIQRDDLSAADIAAFIVSRLSAGEKQKDIAQRLGKGKSYVAMYAAVGQMVPVLRERLATSPIRAVYELHQMWKKCPQAVEEFCAEHDSFTRAQAIIFCEHLGAPSKIDVLSWEEEAPIGPNAQHESSPIVTPNGDGAPRGDGSGELGGLGLAECAHDDASGGSSRPAQMASKVVLVTLRVEHRQRSGRLMLDRGSSKGEAHGLVVFEDNSAVEELPLAALTLVAMTTSNPTS